MAKAQISYIEKIIGVYSQEAFKHWGDAYVDHAEEKINKKKKN